MVRKLLCLLALLAAARAAQAHALPEDVRTLVGAAYPGCGIIACDGWEDGQRGQFAVVVQDGERRILCIAERTAQDAGYALTVDNPRALPEGSTLTGLLIDTDDSLFYSYAVGDGLRETTSVHAGKENGAWGTVGVTAYDRDGETIRSVESFLQGSRLCYIRRDEDEAGNVLDSELLSPMDVNETFARGMRLNEFDANRYDPDPTLGMSDAMIGWLNEANVLGNVGSRLAAVDISAHCRAELIDTVAGSVVCITDWDGGTLRPVQVLGVAPDAGIDACHAGESAVRIDNGGMLYTVSRAETGRWYLTGVDLETRREVGPDWAAPSQEEAGRLPGRNDGFIYGTAWWSGFLPGHIDLARTFSEALERMDTGAYALVNNPSPGDRLHLRVRADKDAQSLGKFYNRTPVQVLQKGDTWTRVRIGLGENSLTGYMMTRYLAFTDEEKAGVVCAFPQLQLREPYAGRGVRLCKAPDPAQGYVGTFTCSREDFVIGVVGETWFVVLCGDGSVGYVLQEALYAGNG